MRFTLLSSSSLGRLGLISNLARLNEFEMETPHVLLYTSGGTVPHLTHEVLQWVSNKQLGLSIPVHSVEHIQDQMKIYQNSIADFIGMKEYLTYCSYINSIDSQMHKSHKKNCVGVWTRNGRKYFTAESYMNFITDLKPDMFLLLGDGDSNLKSSQRRVRMSFDRSEAFFKKCMEIYEQSDSLKSSQVLGAIQGAYDLSLREEGSKLIGSSSVFGVVVDGLQDNGNTISEITINDIKPIVEASLKYIPENKLRVIHGCWNPMVLLGLVELGIDLFDSSYPTFITEQSGALIFPNTDSLLKVCQLNNINGQDANDKCNGDSLITMESKSEGPKSKKFKLENSKFYISMSDPCYITDFNPILKSCTCLTCRNHTRAYIHHLVSVSELLGSTLLMIHNLHHYLIFLSTIRQALKQGNFQEVKKQFQNWFENFSPHS